MEYDVKAEELRRPADDLNEYSRIFIDKGNTVNRTKYLPGTIKMDYYMRKEFMLVDLDGTGSPMWIPLSRMENDNAPEIRAAHLDFAQESEDDENDSDYSP